MGKKKKWKKGGLQSFMGHFVIETSSLPLIQTATEISMYKSENENKDNSWAMLIYTLNSTNIKKCYIFLYFKTYSDLPLLPLPLLELWLGLNSRKFSSRAPLSKQVIITFHCHSADTLWLCDLEHHGTSAAGQSSTCYWYFLLSGKYCI